MRRAALALALSIAACRSSSSPLSRSSETHVAPATVGDTGAGNVAAAAAQTPAAQEPAAAPTTPVANNAVPAANNAAPVAAPSGVWQPPSAEALAAMPLARRMELSVVPFDDATTAHVRAIFAEGARRGLRGDVFAKLGDSITESASFLKDIGHGWYELGPWSRLEPVVRYFRRRSFTGDAENNSFSRASGSATAGWTTNALLAADGHCPVEIELDATHAAFAIMMIGTNDAERSTAQVFERNLRELVSRVEARKVVLVLSTIPDQLSSEEAGRRGLEINTVIRRVAAENHVPLLDYWAAMQGLPHHGIDPDNVHPSVYESANHNVAAGIFTDVALRAGYNVRNLTTLLMLERLMRTLDLR